MEEDFEIIDYPLGSHFSQASRSDKAIEPLVIAMKQAADENAQKGRIFHADLNTKEPSGMDFGDDIVFETFVHALPSEHRATMACQICKSFLRSNGNLCVLSDVAKLVPLLWPKEDAVPAYYREPVAAVRKLFENRLLGKEFLGPFREPSNSGIISATISAVRAHFYPQEDNGHMDFPIPQGVRNLGISEGSVVAMLEYVIGDNEKDTIDRAYRMIHDDELPNTKEYKAPIAWLKNLVDCLSALDLPKPDAVRAVDRYAVAAPPGFVAELYNGKLGKLMELEREGQMFMSIDLRWRRDFRTMEQIIESSDIAMIRER